MNRLFEKGRMKYIFALLVFAIGQLLVVTGYLNDYLFSTLTTLCINIILAVSLNLITGFTGQFSLGHAGFMSIGGYVCALISMRIPTVPGFLLGVLTGALAAALVGFIVGLPTLRLKGDYLAIATLGMAEIIRIIFLNLKITNGAAGLNGIPQFVDWTWLSLFTFSSIILISNFIRSAHGRACVSIREDEIAAESIGIHATKYKVTAFVIGAFFAGIAGGLYASYFYFLRPTLFGFSRSIDILVIVVLGGIGSLSGSVIAAILLALISTYLQAFPELRMVFYAVALVVIMIVRPQGLMGSKELSLDLLKGFGRKRQRGGS